ncbi:alpha/beta fold family hydrolase [Haloferax larsenii JCM 13917]|nr:alpha/beta hydrolase [Haloferax larsenii]ELZ78467.1 alpha/beta fold family hydrolase [Haloferax larsenii JCM 13917]
MVTRIPESVRERTNRDDSHVETVSVGDDRQVAYTEYGCSEGVPVVFFHGTPGSRLVAALFDTAATEHGVRLLAFERPGYGNSTPWDCSIRVAGALVHAVLDDAGVESAGLVAFSGGAPYALSTAATHPERVSRVDVVAGATPPEVGSETPAPLRVLRGLATTAPSILRGLFRGQAWLADRLDPSFVVSQYTTSETAETAGPISDAVAAVVKEDFVEAFRASRRGAVTEFRATATDWDIDFDDIETEVCFWHGDDDANVPIAGVREFRERVPTAQLTVVDDADHLRTLLQSVPEVLATYGDGGGDGESDRRRSEASVHRTD